MEPKINYNKVYFFALIFCLFFILCGLVLIKKVHSEPLQNGQKTNRATQYTEFIQSDYPADPTEIRLF